MSRPRPTLIIMAGSLKAAIAIAERRGMDRVEWRYAWDYGAVKGLDDVDVYLDLTTFDTHPDRAILADWWAARTQPMPDDFWNGGRHPNQLKELERKHA